MLFKPYTLVSLLVLNLLSASSFAIVMTTPSQTTVTTTTVPTTTTIPSTTVPVTAPMTTTTQQVVTQKPIIVTTVPAPKENITIPTGYANCFTVKAGWYQDVWVADHQVCQYPNSPEGVAWVEGYWVCNVYSMQEKQCTTWEWKSAHWEKTLTVY